MDTAKNRPCWVKCQLFRRKKEKSQAVYSGNITRITSGFIGIMQPFIQGLYIPELRENQENNCWKPRVFHIIHRLIHRSYPHNKTCKTVYISYFDRFGQEGHFSAFYHFANGKILPKKFPLDSPSPPNKSPFIEVFQICTIPCLPLMREVARSAGGREKQITPIYFSPSVSYADSSLIRGSLGLCLFPTAR